MAGVIFSAALNEPKVTWPLRSNGGTGLDAPMSTIGR